MKIGLVLSGGMAKGAYQVGALRALREFVPLEKIQYISCASVGVLNGYAFATDNLDEAERMWNGLCPEGSRAFISHILRSSQLQQDIAELYRPEKPMPEVLYCALLDWDHRNIVYKNLSAVAGEQIPQYLKAGVSMPVYNRAVRLDDTAYFDGAMIDNIPVYPLMAHDLDYIICVYFDDVSYKFENAAFDDRIIKITFPSENMVKQSTVFEAESIRRMTQIGYERTRELLREVFQNGYEDLEHICRVIAQRNREEKSGTLRITGDVMVTNLNKVTQKLTRRKIM